jgi:hypothetical protein
LEIEKLAAGRGESEGKFVRQRVEVSRAKFSGRVIEFVVGKLSFDAENPRKFSSWD